MIVRKATRADIPTILAIYNYAVVHTTATADEEPQELHTREKWLDERLRQGYPVLVAELDDSSVVGWACLSVFKARIGYRFSSEDSIYVAADSQGKGVGSALLQKLIEDAATLGLHAVIGVIDGDNEPSIKLHAKYGFVECGRMPQVFKKFGRWLDVVHMVKLLDEPPETDLLRCLAG